MSKTRIIIINGKPRSGKDTVCDLAAELVGTEFVVQNISTVDKVKDAAAALGWEGEKTEEWRNMLHELKMLWIKNFDGPFMDISAQIYFCDRDPSDIIMFVHCREPKEIERFKQKFNDRCTTLLVRRTNCEEANNFADQNVEMYEYDYIIHNEDTTGDWQAALRAKVSDLLNYVIGGNDADHHA